MTVTEYRFVGFIRTMSFLKSVGLFGNRISEMKLVRNKERTIHKDSLPKLKNKMDARLPWFYRRIITKEDYVTDWKSSKHGQVFPTNKVRRLIQKLDIGDLVVERVVFRFRSPRLVQILNADIIDSGRTGPVLLKPDTDFYAVFVNHYRDDYKTLAYIRELNKKELDEHLFKLSCLELVGLWTERAVKYGEKERISVSDDKHLVEAVLHDGLDWSGWPEEERVAKVRGELRPVKPVSKRVEKLIGVKNYALIGEEEVENGG